MVSGQVQATDRMSGDLPSGAVPASCHSVAAWETQLDGKGREGLVDLGSLGLREGS